VDDPASTPTVPGLTGLVVLARGGYSTVYRAVQVSVGRDVAVKIENRALESDHDQRRFLREARAAGRMSSHSFVVDLFDAGVTDDDHPYLVMELCAGSYADLLKQRTLTAHEARDVGMKIADALADAHEVGVLHRDVKPANILITEFGEPTLADFGLAVLAEMRDVSTTLEVLTPAYAPMEMFQHRCEPSPAADVYSLCASLYALLRGLPPRWPDERNPTLLGLVELFERPIPELPGVPAELTEVLRSGMANDPRTRPTAAELRDRLAVLALRPADRAMTLPAAAPRPGRPTVDLPAAWSDTTQARPTDPGRRTDQGRPADAARSTDRDGPIDQVRTPDPDRETTIPSPRRWHIYRGFGALVLILGLLIGSGVWYWPHHRGARALATGPDRVSATASADPAGPGGGTQAGCGFGRTGAVCPARPECFDRVTVLAGAARAKSLPCDGPHTWQAFAIGRLPAGGSPPRYPDLKSQPKVRQLCNPATLALVDLDDAGWRVDVLPPSPEAYAAGDRSFRCVAGTGVDGQSTPAFVH
jgi:serine/threonine protein kinase